MDTKESAEKDNTTGKDGSIDSGSQYPSAQFLVDACFNDYQRLQDNYSKVYEKTNIALAFVGVVLTIMLTTLDFSSLSKDYGKHECGTAVIGVDRNRMLYLRGRASSYFCD